jgi:IPT/TIG domain
MKVGCAASDILFDQQREDKLVHIERDKYYGHPNPKRVSRDNDSRQCVWHNPTESTSSEFQAPMGVLLSSATGIIEYKSDHFDKQLRNNLIHVKYKSGLYRSVLISDGLDVHPLSVPGIPLIGGAGLDVTQAPNGNLIEIRYIANTIFVNRPIEPKDSTLKVHSVFPTRGSEVGGTILKIYGVNFGRSGVSVTVGSKDCPVLTASTKVDTPYIECVLPGGDCDTLVDIVVTSITPSRSQSYTFAKGYRYIGGKGFR